MIRHEFHEPRLGGASSAPWWTLPNRRGPRGRQLRLQPNPREDGAGPKEPAEERQLQKGARPGRSQTTQSRKPTAGEDQFDGDDDPDERLAVADPDARSGRFQEAFGSQPQHDDCEGSGGGDDSVDADVVQWR